MVEGDGCRQGKALEHPARSPRPALVQQLNVVVVTWACSRYGLSHKVDVNLPFGTGDGQTGSNANVADGGTRKGTRSDEIRPIIRPWPLPPLRPKRAASRVAGLRYGTGRRKTNHALISETSTGKPQPQAIPPDLSRRHSSIFCLFLPPAPRPP